MERAERVALRRQARRIHRQAILLAAAGTVSAITVRLAVGAYSP